MKEKCFHRDVWLYGMFLQSCILQILMLKNLTVRWLIEKRTLLEENNLFLLLRVYELVMF